MTRKTFFDGVVLVQIHEFRNGTRYGLEILQQRGKSGKTKSQNARSCREKTGEKVWIFANRNLPTSITPTLNRVDAE